MGDLALALKIRQTVRIADSLNVPLTPQSMLFGPKEQGRAEKLRLNEVFNHKTAHDTTFTILKAPRAIAVEVWGQSCSGLEGFKALPHLRSVLATKSGEEPGRELMLYPVSKLKQNANHKKS